MDSRDSTGSRNSIDATGSWQWAANEAAEALRRDGEQNEGEHGRGRGGVIGQRSAAEARRRWGAGVLGRMGEGEIGGRSVLPGMDA